MENKTLFGILLLVALVSPACNVFLTPQVANTSSYLNASAIPAGNYTFRFADYDNNTLNSSTVANSTLYYINSTFNQTRIYVYANNSTFGACSNYSLILTPAQTTQQSNLFQNTIFNWATTYASLIFGILAAGIAYGLTIKIGHAALATSVMWAALFIMFGNVLFVYGAITALVAGLVLTYANV